MSWLFLVFAGIMEIGWPVGLKIAQNPDTKWYGIFLAIIFMTISGGLLWAAQRSIPMGTAYAIWTGIGATGTFIIGILYYGEPANLVRCMGALLIILGVVVLKVSH
ncbi:multidrug efflux SMR transporter [Tolumonas auensis]|uniref:DMT family transporter n=1 Tax=Tolumonas auensis TaxID=43948 RepID=UPI002AA6C456|nr:multidrug efflux SMR transporter [Tolumonas auensis]